MKTQIIILMLFVTAGVCNADLTWEYDSPLNVYEEITDIGGGNYRYEYSFENVDTSIIHSFIIYTEFIAQGQSDFDGFQHWVGHFVTVGGIYPGYDSINPEYDPRILDEDITGGVWTGYEYWEGEEYGIQVNDFVSGFSFTSTTYDPLPKYYSYTTIETSGPDPYESGIVSAVGTTIPEPGTVFLFGAGVLILFKRNKSV